ncbi:hypothetical protein ACJJTC_000433 [Scirpophaga incertulas]
MNSIKLHQYDNLSDDSDLQLNRLYDHFLVTILDVALQKEDARSTTDHATITCVTTIEKAISHAKDNHWDSQFQQYERSDVVLYFHEFWPPCWLQRWTSDAVLNESTIRL